MPAAIKITSDNCSVLSQTAKNWNNSSPNDTRKELKYVIGLADKKTGHWLDIQCVTDKENTFLVKDNNGVILGVIRIGGEGTRAVLQNIVNLVLCNKGRRQKTGLDELCDGCNLHGKKECIVKQIEKIVG